MLSYFGFKDENIAAEIATLAALLIDGSKMFEIIKLIPGPEYFELEIHKQIYEICIDFFKNNIPIDFVSVLDKISDKSIKVYFFKIIVKIAQLVPLMSRYKFYAKILIERHKKNLLQSLCYKILGLCKDMPPENIIDVINLNLSKIKEINAENNIDNMRKAIEIEYKRIKSIKDGLKPKIIETGYENIDSIIDGFSPSELILLAARPGVGKTSFALNLALKTAVEHNSKVIMFSIEMYRQQIVWRMLSVLGSIELNRIKKGDLNKNECKLFEDTSIMLENLDILIDDISGGCISKIRSICLKSNAIDLVIIDYLQLIKSETKNFNRNQEISEITRQLKLLSKEINAPILLLSQLSRATETRSDKRPVLSDLRDSGSIEQDADMVIFLYRDSYYNLKESKKEEWLPCECIIAKNRNGKVGIANIWWNGSLTKFGNDNDIIDNLN
jgi:replicative DNA helicase